MEQLQQTGVMMRQACQPKFKVSDEQVNGISQDKQFPDDKNLKCFVNCVLEMMQVMKKGKLQFDGAMRSMQTMLPDELKDDQINALTACKTAAAGIKDNCEASYATLKCQSQNAQTFLFV